MLRKLALQARQRLNGVSRIKRQNAKKDVSSVTIYRNLYKDNFKIISYDSRDKEFYEKVKMLITSSPDSPKMLRELVDFKEYSKLDDAQKIGYMLNLAERYHQTKEQLQKEQLLNNVM
jgi:hypothetical protein